MTIYANGAAFDERKSRLLALGTDVSAGKAIVDLHGNVLAYPRSGGMINPERYELEPNSKLFRFGGGAADPQAIAKGSWWIEHREFATLLRFGATHGISVGLAMRLLCLVPPEWSDATILVRARVTRSLLAWRGVSNSVVIPPGAGHKIVNMPHQNDIAARRLHQLFIPGLSEIKSHDPAISIENVYRLDSKESAQGFLYL
ncbi:MAG: hypothetical protein ABI607_11835 [Betaproteobacteria bacterium]